VARFLWLTVYIASDIDLSLADEYVVALISTLWMLELRLLLALILAAACSCRFQCQLSETITPRPTDKQFEQLLYSFVQRAVSFQNLKKLILKGTTVKNHNNKSVNVHVTWY